tara:strand:- start:229 stop:399 length:171 start_codon:yes stop_codon:yes gene_type:complete
MLLLDQLLKNHPVLKDVGSLPGLSVLGNLPSSRITKKTPAGKLFDSAASRFKKRYG